MLRYKLMVIIASSSEPLWSPSCDLLHVDTLPTSYQHHVDHDQGVVDPDHLHHHDSVSETVPQEQGGQETVLQVDPGEQGGWEGETSG